MKIKYAIAFNWGNLARKTYPFKDGLNMIVGDSGSGKSTIMDLIQAVMVADTKDIRNYNAGQGEIKTKKQSKKYRSFPAYLLGADQFQFTRKESLGVVACVFEDKEGALLTAWLFGSAEVQGSKENQTESGGLKSMGICAGHAFTEDDFTKKNDKGELELKEMEELHRHLNSTYKMDSEIFSSRKEYLMKLYGAFNGVSTIGYPEAVKAAKAFVRYIYPTQTENVHDFVKEELLETKDLSKVVASLQDIMRSYDSIQKEAENISKSKESLEKAVLGGSKLFREWHTYYDESYLYAKRREYRYLKDIASHEKQFNTYTRKKDSAIKESEKLEAKLEALNAEAQLLTQNNSETDILKEKQRLSSELGTMEDNRRKKEIELGNILSEYEYVASCIKIAEQVSSPFEYEGHEVINNLYNALALGNNNDQEKIEALSSLAKDLEKFLSTEGDYYKSVEKKEVDLSVDRRQVENEHELLKGVLEKYRVTGKSSYLNEKDIFLLNSELPEAKARPICEFIRLTDTSWQSAIEGFLGGARFSLVVEPEYEEAAAELMLNRGCKSKIVQGEKLLRDMEKMTRETKSNSIVRLMEFTHPIAEASMILNYGNVLQVGSTEELRFTSRGLTQKGLGSSGYTMFRCLERPQDCFIGEGARKERFEHFQKDEISLMDKKKKISDSFVLANEARKKLDGITIIDPLDVRLELINLEGSMDGLQKQISSLTLSDQKEISERLTEITMQVKECKEKERKVQREVGEYGRDAEAKKSAIIRIKSSLEETREELKETEKLLASPLLGELEERREHLARLQEDAKQSFNNSDRHSSFNDRTKDLFYAYKNLTESHNRESIRSAMVPLLPEVINSSIEAYGEIAGIYAKHTSVFDEVSKNILIEKLDELRSRKEEFDKTFREEFCSRVYISIEEGKSKLDRINNMLRRHQFGDERYAVKYKFSAEFKPIYNYFKYLEENIPGTLTYVSDLPEEHMEAKETIEKLLMEEDVKKKMNGLDKFADYREYREYDIHKILNNDEEHSISLNKLATDSGGQATTSYYVIRSIAAYSAFDRDNPRYKGDGLGFLLIDEAFNRVDDRRPGAILNYLINDLGFQIISAMPPQNENVFTKYVTARYLIFKEVVDPSYENYKIIQHAQYSVQNIKPINELLEAEKKRVRLEQMGMEL